MAHLNRIYIDRSVATAPLVREIVARIEAPTAIIDGAEDLYRVLRKAPDPIAAGKEILYLTANKGGFIRKCPGTKHYHCCDYMILHIGTFCTMDCAYCILQSYFHPPVLQYFVNHDQLFDELQAFLASRRHRRIGTGEYTDSMIWELWTDLSQKLIPCFASQAHAVLELKTKTTHVDRILSLPHSRRTILSWSVNTPEVIRRNERGTASLEARIRAAARCQRRGYPLAFHFDPIVEYPGCVEDYRSVVNTIFDHIPPDDIVWISLGTLRFMPDLKPVIQTRWPHSKLPYGEFVSGLDGKSRYLKTIRIDLYSRILETVRKRSQEVTVYFCMESEEVWQKVFGFTPDRYGGLAHMLDRSAVKKCRLAP